MRRTSHRRAGMPTHWVGFLPVLGTLRWAELSPGGTMAELTTLTLPVLPLTTGVVLPQMVLTVALESDEARAAAAAAGDDGHLLLVPRIDDRYASVGVVARIESTGTLPNGTEALVIRALHRAKV